MDVYNFSKSEYEAGVTEKKKCFPSFCFRSDKITYWKVQGISSDFYTILYHTVKI